MDLNRLYAILRETTVQLRKGEVYEGTPELVEQAKAGQELKGGGVLEINMMPHVDDASDRFEKVDVEFLVIGVDKTAAERHRDELITILKTYPEQARLAKGPSYIEVGAIIGDQGAAFQLFALGHALGFWKVLTPAVFGITGDEARTMAGNGFVLISGLKVD